MMSYDKEEKNKTAPTFISQLFREKNFIVSREKNPLEPNGSSLLHLDDYLRRLIFANVTFISIEYSDKMLLPYYLFIYLF